MIKLSNEHIDNFVSASYKKIKSSASDVAHQTNINNSPATAVTTDTEISETSTTGNTDSSFLLIDTSILKDIINCIGICPSWQSKSIPNIDQINYLPVTLLCTTCNWTTKYYTSRKVKSNSKVNSCCEVNVRAVMAMKDVGCGHAALEKLCGFLNLPEHPMELQSVTYRRALLMHTII